MKEIAESTRAREKGGNKKEICREEVRGIALEGVTRRIHENPKHLFSSGADNNDGLTDRTWPTMGSQERPSPWPRDPSVQIEDKFRICRGSTTRDERLKEGGRIRRVAIGSRTSRFFLVTRSITITGDVSFIPIIVASLDDNDSKRSERRRFHEITTNEWRWAGDWEYCRV